MPELTDRPRAAVSQRELCGWGRLSPARSRVVSALDAEQVADALTCGIGAGAIARGAGCSYGDAAQTDNGTVIDTTRMDRVLEIDVGRGIVTAQAGATIATLMSRLAAHALTLPVVPGTRHVTVAGAIASDVHGKNHHVDGAFARHVESITLIIPSGEQIRLTADGEPELFFATLGGMGLTGVVVEATLRATPMPHPWVLEDVDRTGGLEETLELLGGEEPRTYSVAWLDMLAGGSKMGRAVVSRADPMPASERPPRVASRRGARRSFPGALFTEPLIGVPAIVPGGILRPSAMGAFNRAYWQATPRIERERPKAIAPYFFPLDVIGGWNRLYGGGGFIQYQFVIPAGRDQELRSCFELMRGLPVYLAVFKRFGGSYGGPLSFPLEGWTLAADLPAGAPGVRERLDLVDDVVAGCGGRVYLSKDSRLRREHIDAMYPQIGQFRAARERVDPGGRLRSDLSTRLDLDGERS